MLESKATLRVSSDVLSLSELSNVLGTHGKGFSKGDCFLKGKRQRNHTQWSLTSNKSEQKPLEIQILGLLDFLSGKDLSEIQSDIEVDLFCMLSSDNGQGSFSFSPELSARIGALGLSITFDFYSD